MESLHKSMRQKMGGSQPHSHDGQGGHTHGATDAGSRLMRFLSMLSPLANVDEWLSDYRGSRIVPASNGALAAVVVATAAGAGLWLTLPAGIRWIGLVVAILGGAYLALQVIGGAAIGWFIRHVRGVIRQTVLGAVAWTGSERVLDVGCGTGLLVNGCAGKLTTGKATGIDLWQQAVGGTASVLMTNARAEGVADRVEYREMDARELGFEDASFDVVVSSTALHHIGTTREEVEQAVSEMVRVLAPGGSLALADIAPMIEIARTVIEKAGLQVTLDEQMPAVHVVAARKSEASGL